MNLKSFLLVVGASAALAGCSQSNEPTSKAADKPVTGQEVKQDYKNALNATKDYLGQGKDEFLGTIKSKMKDLDGKIDELAKKSGTYKDDAKVQADKALAGLREQREAVGKKYDELKASSQETWEK